jgi:hypothetical protein
VNTIQVNYDLISPGKDYEKLFEFLRNSPGGWAKPLKSMWFVRTNRSAGQLRDAIKSYVDANDELVTVDVTYADWATNFRDSTVEWMVNNMPGPRGRVA